MHTKRYGFCRVPITKKGIALWKQRELDFEAISLFYQLIATVNRKKDLRCYVCNQSEIDLICDNCDRCYCVTGTCANYESNRPSRIIHGVYHIDNCSSCTCNI